MGVRARAARDQYSEVTPVSNKLHYYKDAQGKYRWRFVARNGRIRADSAEGYDHLSDCAADWHSVRNDPVVEVYDDSPAVTKRGPPPTPPKSA